MARARHVSGGGLIWSARSLKETTGNPGSNISASDAVIHIHSNYSISMYYKMLLILGNTWRFRLCNVSYEIEFCKTGLVDAAMGVSRASFQLEAWSLYGVRTPAAGG